MRSLKYLVLACAATRWFALTILLVVLGGKAYHYEWAPDKLRAVGLFWTVLGIVLIEIFERLLDGFLQAKRVFEDPLPFLCQLPPPFGWIATIATMALKLWRWAGQDEDDWDKAWLNVSRPKPTTTAAPEGSPTKNETKGGRRP